MTPLAVGLTLAVLASGAVTKPRMTGDDAKVTVSADHAEWTGAAPAAKGDAIEIPLKAGATAQRVELADKTVKRIEIVGGESPRMIVRLHHSKATTQRTVSALQVGMHDGVLAVTFPREPARGADAQPAAVEPAKVEPAAAEPAAVEPAKVEPAKVEPAPMAALLPTPPAPVAKEAPIAFAEEPSHGGGRIGSIIVILVLGAVAGIAAMLRKKRGAQAAEEPFRVVASKTLGGKAKIFMVEVEDAKLIFTVDEKGTRLVHTLGKGQATPASQDDLDALTEQVPRFEEPATSPAVAGLLKLRERHNLDDAANDEAASDTDWAAMLLRATNRRGPS